MTREVMDRMLPGQEVEPTIVGTEDEARTREFLGSPSIRIDRIDIEGRRGDFQGMACRVYEGVTGIPEVPSKLLLHPGGPAEPPENLKRFFRARRRR